MWGQAEGLQGRTYRIQTKDSTIRRTLSIEEIKSYVDRFIEFARENSQLQFMVTEIGCELSGYKPKDIVPLFEGAIDLSNVHLPYQFWRKIKRKMTDNKTLILEEFEKLKGQFVITDSWKIERLIAIGEDEWDYYWVTYNGRKLTWNTCVGRVMPLKGHLRDKDYKKLVRIARLNHYDQATQWGKDVTEESERFVKEHKLELMKIDSRDKFLTDICWEMYD